MAKRLIINLALLLVFIVGCEEEKYSIEMKPRKNGLERRLVLSGKFSDEERKLISGLYDKQIDPNTFVGTFVDNLPNDLGGAGYYTTFSSDMGETTIYSERFKGDDNLNDTVKQIQLVADRFIDFLIEWVGYEIGGDPNFINLKAFCDAPLRNEARNMAIYFWLSGILQAYDDNAYEEIMMRIKHYLLEHGYFGPKQVYVLDDGSGNGQEQALRSLRQIIIDKMGYSCAKIATERLLFLSDSMHAEESMARYIRTTDYFRKEWEAEKHDEKDPNVEQLDVDVEGYIMRNIDLKFELFAFGREINVKLVCKNKPFDTNGEWDPNSNQVVWSATIAGDGKLPTFFYAQYSDPHKKFQEEHFGHVVLCDKTLAEYCAWRERIDTGQGKEWDSFIFSLDPNQNLEQRVSSFRFSDYKPKEEEFDTMDGGISKTICDYIIAALKRKTEEKGNKK